VGLALPILKLSPDGPVALAGGFFQAGSVQDRDLASRSFDQSGSPQNTGGDGHTGAASAQHLGWKFLSQRQNMRINPSWDISNDLASRRLAAFLLHSD
jgi:hypothetical protein